MSRLVFALSVLIGCVGLISATTLQAGEEKKTGKTVTVFMANETGEPIFFFVCGKHGTTGKIDLGATDIIGIQFYDDKNERALDAFDKNGKKVLSMFKFIPGEFCLLIENNQKEMKQVEVGSKKETVKYSGKPQ